MKMPAVIITGLWLMVAATQWLLSSGTWKLLRYFLLLSALLIGCLSFIFHAQDPIVLEPLHSHSSTAVLIYLPGASVPSEAYIPVVRAIQNEFDAFNVSLNCLVVRYHKLLTVDVPLFWDPELLISNALRHIDPIKHGVPLFIGGHSVGAILSQIVAFNDDRTLMYNGVVLHGGFVMDKHRLNGTLKVPAITISGTRDGLNRLTYLSTQYQDLRNQSQYLFNSPAALIEGMNHMQVANGYGNTYTRTKDLNPTITVTEAINQLSAYSAVFLLNCMGQNVDLRGLADLVQTSEDHFFRPYIDALDSDISGATCVRAQELHLGRQQDSRHIFSSTPFLSKIQRPRFIFSKPRGNNTHVNVQTYATKANTLFGRSSVPQAIQTLNCKLITKEQLFGRESEVDSCGDINLQILNEVLATVAEGQRRDYLSSANRYVFDKDHDFSNGFGWTFRGALEFSWSKSELVEVICPRLKTKPGPGRYDGKLHCGLISKSRVVEHILVDAYRKRPISAITREKGTEEL
jgi:hypothetical protein